MIKTYLEITTDSREVYKELVDLVGSPTNYRKTESKRNPGKCFHTWSKDGSIKELCMFILPFIDLIEHKVQLWALYEYEDQCNYELSVEEIRMISDLGLSFCFTAWEK